MIALDLNFEAAFFLIKPDLGYRHDLSRSLILLVQFNLQESEGVISRSAAVVQFLATTLAQLQLLRVQDDCGSGCKVNSNLAMVLNRSVDSTAKVMGSGWGESGGIGYNFNQRNAVIGEFLWNRMNPSD